MNFYKLIITYDGTDYSGWQYQPNVPTITGELQKKFYQAFKQNVSIIGASRTDAGVHAMGQVALIKSSLAIDSNGLKNAWNNILNKDILITSCEKADESFNPMLNVEQKVYFYNFFLQRPSPFEARYGLYHFKKIDIDKLKNCLALFEGTHDFRSFSTGYERENTIRTIDSIELQNIDSNSYRVIVKGKSFLHHMIRRIVGACLDVSSDKKQHVSVLTKALEDKNPEQTFLNAGPEGLILYKILYKMS